MVFLSLLYTYIQCLETSDMVYVILYRLKMIYLLYYLSLNILVFLSLSDQTVCILNYHVLVYEAWEKETYSTRKGFLTVTFMIFIRLLYYYYFFFLQTSIRIYTKLK